MDKSGSYQITTGNELSAHRGGYPLLLTQRGFERKLLLELENRKLSLGM